MRSDNRPSGQSSDGAGGQRSFIEEARRTQIVECAIDAIADLGYHGASLSQIARRAGVSKGVISYHFAGKDELIEQVVAHVYTAGGQFMWEHGLKTAESASEQLRAYLESNLAFIATHRREVMVVGEIFMNFRDKDGRSKFDPASEEPIFAPLVEMLEQGQRDGEFRAFDTRVMALAIRRLVDATATELVVRPDTDIDRYIAAAVDLFDHATRADAPAPAPKTKRAR